ncbi:MAG: TraR/DksA family transcriptional regulator [Pirellulaceae bacterium]|jgi:DnaK suppressor protein|nr:TraR/DksA family transcriptional regulator [Pirellulaceae bacterium]
MSSTDYTSLKMALQIKLQDLEDRAERIENRLSDPGSPDWEENAALHSNDEVLNALSDLTHHDIQEIRLAISRIDEGSYGTCAQCGSKIGQPRLKLLPFTSTCVSCA